MESVIPGDHKAGTGWAVSPNASSPGLLGWEPFFFFQLAIRPKAPSRHWAPTAIHKSHVRRCSAPSVSLACLTHGFPASSYMDS